MFHKWTAKAGWFGGGALGGAMAMVLALSAWAGGARDEGGKAAMAGGEPRIQEEVTTVAAAPAPAPAGVAMASEAGFLFVLMSDGRVYKVEPAGFNVVGSINPAEDWRKLIEAMAKMKEAMGKMNQ